jgi:hypothetical protein
MSRSATTRLIAATVVILSVGLVAGPTSSASAPKKMFGESLSVTTTAGAAVTGPLAAATSYDFAFRLTNATSSPQAFGSALIVVPTGFTVGTLGTNVANFHAASTTAGVLVTSTGPTGTGITPGSSLTVTARVTTPTAGACRATWTTFVKQSNDFSGTGNDFQPADPAPATTTGGGSLAFSRQPVTTQWNVAMDLPPTVTAKDPCGATLSTFSDAVTVTDGLSELVTGGSATATSGVATLSNLTFADYGLTDTLTASASGFTPVTSDAFDIVQSLVACAAGATCTSGQVSDKDVTTFVSITADKSSTAGQISTTVKGLNAKGLFPSCDASGEPPLGAVTTFNVTDRAKTVTMTLPKNYVNQIPNNGTPFMDICLDVPVGSEFVDKSGKLTTTGLLPDCTTTRKTVCVVSRGKNAGNEIVTFRLPAGDPHSSWF